MGGNAAARSNVRGRSVLKLLLACVVCLALFAALTLLVVHLRQAHRRTLWHTTRTA